MGTVRNKLSLFLLGGGVPGSLKVTEHELQTMTWPMLVDKIVKLQRHQRLCIVRQLSAHDIVSRIMRKENYMIGLLNKGVLALTLPQWVPGMGPVLGQDEHGAKKRVILTKTLEWSLNWCILQSMFDRHYFPCCPYARAHSSTFLCNSCS
jgi:autophagy-related protein 9